MLGLLNKLKKHIPNTLTWLRGLGTLVIICLFLNKPTNFSVWVFWIFTFSAFTDFLDGRLARQWQVVSNMGKILDPLFDKVLVFSLLILLYPFQIVPAIIIILLIFRDVSTDIMRYYLLAQKEVVAAIRSAKYKTVFQMLMIFFMLIYLSYGELWYIKKISLVLGILAVFFSLYSGFLYVRNFYLFLKNNQIKSSNK